MPKVIGTVFGLNDVYALLKQNTTVNSDDYWPVQPTYAIWVDGVTASTTFTGSNVYRMDYKSETLWSGTVAANPAPFGASFRGGISDNKQRYGWFIGGNTASATVNSRIVRLDLTGDVSTVPQNWPAATMGVDGLSHEGYGYGIGGGDASAAVSSCFKFDYSSETITPITNLPGERLALAGFGDGDNAWFTGGISAFAPAASRYSNTTKLDYSTDTFSASVNHPISEMVFAGSCGTEYYGFTFGGGNTTAISSTRKFDFTNETYSTGTGMPQIRRTPYANADEQYGYILGGAGPTTTTTTFPALRSSILRYEFDADTWNLPGFTGLNRGARATASTGGVSRIPSHSFNGYHFGGYGPTSYRSTVIRHDFNSDTYTTLTPLGTARGSKSCAAVSDGDFYLAGGFSTTQTDAIDYFDYNVENGAANISTLPTARSGVAGAENASSDYAYFCGGATAAGAYISNVERFDLSVMAQTQSTNLPGGRVAAAPTASTYLKKTFLFGGDSNPGPNPVASSTVMKMDWSTETWDDSVNMPSGFYDFKVFHNNISAWICPGTYTNATSTIYRWDFATDTRTTLSPIGSAKSVPLVTWSNYIGYISGGIFNPTSSISFDMGTETTAAATSLPQARGDGGSGTNTTAF